MQQDQDKIEELRERLEALKGVLDFDGKKKELKELEAKSADPDLWKDKEKAAELMKQMGRLAEEIRAIERLDEDLGNAQMQKEIKMHEELKSRLTELELKTYLGGRYDDHDIILSIHAGQGGTEAMDWAAMLHRMYAKYCDKKSWRWKVIDETAGEEAGIKSITMTVSGEHVYGHLKGEAGVHRLVRQSPFNADKLRQTSFALVEVLPQIEEVVGVEIKDDDLEWNFFRASTQGGQNVQKVSSAVRLKHKTSGIVVTCQAQRYQEQNRKMALKLLKAKLWAQDEEKRKKEEKKLKGEHKMASWGNQIRSYVLHPYKMVKDLRTGVESNQPNRVLDGDLDKFVEEEIKMMI